MTRITRISIHNSVATTSLFGGVELREGASCSKRIRDHPRDPRARPPLPFRSHDYTIS